MIQKDSRSDPKERGDYDRTEEIFEPATAGKFGFFLEFREFLGDNKKYWMIPILVALLLAAIFILLAGAATTPFIYTLF